MSVHDNRGLREPPATVEAATRLVEKGFSLIPLHRPYARVLGSYLAKKNGKYPLTMMSFLGTSLGHKTPTSTFAKHPDANIGILTGRPYGVVIIDVDFPQGGESSMQALDLPGTLTAVTGNGLHLYYRHPGGRIPTCSGRLAPGIDVKGEHSFATAPPSLHASGHRYRWREEDVAMSELPGTTVGRLRQLPQRGVLRDFVHILALVRILLPASALLARLLSGTER